MHIDQERRIEIMTDTMKVLGAIQRHGSEAREQQRTAEVNAMGRLGEGIAQMALELTSTLSEVTA